MIVNKQTSINNPDSVVAFSDSTIQSEGVVEYFFECNLSQDSLKRPFKIVHYSALDTAYYSNGVKVGYYIDQCRGDEIAPHWLSVGTVARGFTFGTGYYSFNKKGTFFESYAGVFGMLYPGSIKMFSAGANYTKFFYKKEKNMSLYQAVLPEDDHIYYMNSEKYYQTQADIVKNKYWGYQFGFTFDNINGERASTYFYAENQKFQLLQIKSLAGMAGLTRFVVKNLQLSFGKDRNRILKAANYRRLSLLLAYYPLTELKYTPIDEGVISIADENVKQNVMGSPVGWRISWDGRIAFWTRRDFGFTYKYGVEQTPFRQYGRNGLVPIICGGFFFNVGCSKKNVSAVGPLMQIP
ncbi:MAG: hypothetical protein ACOZCO_08730 [Bacteroidota bacterium]